MTDEPLAVFIDFENIAIWAAQELIDLDVTRLMENLQTRGPVVIKRAYGDWGRFSTYRDDLLNNSIDLIQMYRVSAAKNRADIRLAIDALEIAIQRPQIQTFVIVSGDSDFGALVQRLREYSRYTIGIGPRGITHPLLVKACDEFLYLDTLLGVKDRSSDRESITEREKGRRLLRRALDVYGQRGELPVLTAKLKPMLTSMDSTFNEANLGYSQFRDWLESNGDIVRLFFKDLQMYAAPANFATPGGFELQPSVGSSGEAAGDQIEPPPLTTQYKQQITVRKLALVDLDTRRDVLRDIYRELSQRPDEWTPDALLNDLTEQYASRGLMRSRTMLLGIWQLGFRQRTYEYAGQQVSFHAPVHLHPSIADEAMFVRRAECAYVQAVIQSGLEIDRVALADLLLNDPSQTDYIDTLLDDLAQRGVLVRSNGEYKLSAKSAIPFKDDPDLQVAVRDIEAVQLTDDVTRTVETARTLANKAMVQRSQDFLGAAQTWLHACRCQWDLVKNGERDATLEDLRWYVASYVATKAGALSQVGHDYGAARPYYLAFFALVQEDDPLWDRMRGLINPMLSYYWTNTARELGLTFQPHNSPARTAVEVATHTHAQLHDLWRTSCEALAKVNPRLVRRVAEQIRLNAGESGDSLRVADELDALVNAA